MYQRILVPLDGSSTAEIVLPYVEEIAAKLSAEIVLVSVAQSAAKDVDQLYRSYLERVTEQVQHQLSDWGDGIVPKVHHEILLGTPAGEILRYADQKNVGLIAMASRGSSGRGPWLLGSIVAKVIRATARPVLLIRAPASDAARQQKRLVKRILVPLDGSQIGEAAIPHTELLAPALGAEIVLFQVVEPVAMLPAYGVHEVYPVVQDSEAVMAAAIAYLEDVGKSLKTKGLKTSSAVDFGSPAAQIIDYAKTNAIDLIAMSTHGRSGIGRWVFGSVTDKVLHAGDTAVLVIRPAKA